MKTIEELMAEIEKRMDEKIGKLTAPMENKLKGIPDPAISSSIISPIPEKKKLEWEEVCERVALIAKAQIFKDPRAFAALQKADWLNSVTGSEGAFLTPTEFSDQIFTLANDYGVARKECFSVPMRSVKKEMPAGLTGVEMFYTAQGGKKGISKPSFGKVTLEAQTAAGIALMTQDVIDDSAPDLAAYLLRIIPEALTKREDESCFFGNGDRIAGIVNTTNPDSVITVPASGASVEAVTLDDLNRMKYAIKGSAARGAKWFCNRNFVGVLERIKDTETGKYLLTTSPDGTTQKIWGFEIATTDAFPAIPTANDVVMVFGNLQNCYFGNRKELAILPSDQATIGVYDSEGTLKDILSAYQQNMRFIRFEVRHDFKPALGSAFAKLQLTAS